MDKEKRYNGKTKEEILSSPRLKGNRKGKYGSLLLFPNSILPNNNFKTTTVVGLKSDNIFEIIGDCYFISPVKCKFTIHSTSVDATLIVPQSQEHFEVYGFGKDRIIEILDIFMERDGC